MCCVVTLRAERHMLTFSAALPSQQQTITKQAIALAASGAVLGPLCDGQHSKYGVLHYVNATMLNVPICNLQLETCWYNWSALYLLSALCKRVLDYSTESSVVHRITACDRRWVPLLFGFAAVILGVGHPALDDRSVHHGVCDKPSAVSAAHTCLSLQLLLQQFAPHYDVNPPWSVVMVGISAFVLQYAASGVLEVPLLYQAVARVPALDTLLCGTAVLHWYAFDRSPQGEHCTFMTPAIVKFPHSSAKYQRCPTGRPLLCSFAFNLFSAWDCQQDHGSASMCHTT